MMDMQQRVVREKNTKCPTCGKPIGFRTHDMDNPNEFVYHVGNRHRNPDGSIGGWVSVTSKVGRDATITRNAFVYGNATVMGEAKVSGNANVFDNAKIRGRSHVYEDAMVYEDAIISENANVYGEAQVSENARVYGNARVYENAFIYGQAQILEHAKVYGKAHVNMSAEVAGNAQVFGEAEISGTATIEGDIKVHGNAYIDRGNYYIGDVSQQQDQQQLLRRRLEQQRRRIDQQQNRRRQRFRQQGRLRPTTGGKMQLVPGLQGKGKQIFQQLKRKQEQQTVRIPSHLLDPITGDLLEDPVIANDGHIYSRKTFQRMLGMRVFGGVQLVSILPDQSKRLQTLRQEIKQFLPKQQQKQTNKSS
jgi:carbonic anhydrase/acetyltransferase-like protein (isoleucine patch superfamily)